MRRLWLCLFLAACQASDDSSGSPRDASNNPIDGVDDDAAVASDGGTPPVNNGPDAARPPTGKPDGSVPPTGEPKPDYRKQGTISVANKTESFAGTTCSFTYESFTPATTSTETSVVIAPGFSAFGVGGSRENMRTLATHISSWGVTTYTVDLCTNGFMIDHPKNGAAMAEFGAKVGAAGVIYAGFSAGGLGAMYAASQATNVTAYLGLDAVDRDNLAKAALDAIKKPVYALTGEPSGCNDQGNMAPQYAGRTLPVLKVNNAQHFNFEGTACEGPKCLPCPGGSEVEASAIRALATAAIMGLSGADANALSWWEEDSAGFKALAEGGVITRTQ